MQTDKISGLVTLILGPPLAIGGALIDRITSRETAIGITVDYLIENLKDYIPQIVRQKAKGYIDGFMHPYGKNYRTGNSLAGR